MENQSNSTTFTMIVKTAKVKNALFAVTNLLHLILTMHLSHTLSKKIYWYGSSYKLMIVAIHESVITAYGSVISPYNPLLFHS